MLNIFHTRGGRHHLHHCFPFFFGVIYCEHTVCYQTFSWLNFGKSDNNVEMFEFFYQQVDRMGENKNTTVLLPFLFEKCKVF